MEAIDPGAGEPSGIRRLAERREAAAERLHNVRSEVVAADSAVPASEWTGQARAAFGAAVAHALPDLDLIISGLHAQSAALRSYAGEVQRLKDEQAILDARRRASRIELGRVQADFLLGSHQSYAAATEPSEAQLSRLRLEQSVAREKAALAAADTQYQHLVDRRRRLDGATATELAAPAVLGPVAALTAIPFWPTAASLFTAIGGLSATDVRVLLADRPEFAQIIAGADPRDVAAWWTSLAMPGGGQSALQLSLIAAIPAVMGSLNGLPARARTQANVFNARTQMEKDEKLIDKYKDDPTTVTRLRSEMDYLRRAVGEHPTVKLYLYDPAASRIIEMIGTPSAATRNVITYVPGTFTNLGSFYGKGVQQVAHALVDPRADSVGFIYKDGLFPGESDNSDSLDVARIPEANNEGRALDAGRQLAAFQTAVQLDPELSGSRTVAIGHSWGLAAVTASEVAGAHYDNVVSLSGAGMPQAWSSTTATKYMDLSYLDTLQEAQVAGGDLVWGGNVPRANAAFQHDGYYQGPEDPVARLPNGTTYGLDQGVLLSNHNLVATSGAANQGVIDALTVKLFGSSRAESHK